MRSIQRSPKTKLTAAEAEAMARRDKRRMTLMGVGLLLLVGAYVYGRVQSSKYSRLEQETQSNLVGGPGETQEVSALVFPEFPNEILEDVRDASEDQRLVPNAAALQSLLVYGNLLTPRHFAEMGVGELESVESELTADPGAFRKQALRARGEIVLLHKRTRPKTDKTFEMEEHFGTLRRADGGFAHFVVAKPPAADELAVGDYARIDGLFLQLARREVAGEFRDGALLLARQLMPSIPYLVLGEDLDTPALASVRDDSFEEHSGIPFDAEWQLMAKARQNGELFDAGRSQVDWDAAPEINSDLLTSIYKNGQPFRGMAFRIPISTNLETRVLRQDQENPLHLTQLTEGWIGNWIWKGPAKAIKYHAPWVREELADYTETARLVIARGYFLKNINIEMGDGSPGRVPFFVMESVEVFTPEPDRTPMYLMWGVTIVTVLLAMLLWFLLRRDKRESARLHRDLVARRRARRAQTLESGDSKGLATQEN